MRVIKSVHISKSRSQNGSEGVLGLGDPGSEVVLTIGTFDGVHRGHQRLLAGLVRRAKETGRLSAALTFCSQPRLSLHPELQPAYLTTLEEKGAILESLGLDLLLLLPFTRALADTPAEAFVRQIYDQLRMRELWVGDGFAMGRGRAGDTARLQALAAQLGYVLRVVPPVYDNGQVISSTRIRRLILEGKVGVAAQLLGRPYALSGGVGTGAQRGRSLGICTANLSIETEKVVPADGVYAVWGLVEGERHQSVANVGVRPTFGRGERMLEVHLIDHRGDLYGKNLTVEFVQRLRPEIRFDDVADLVRQIHRDIAVARAVLMEKRVQETNGALTEHKRNSACRSCKL